MPTLWRGKRDDRAVLNRIYIIVGTLAIIVLAGAFIAPRFIQWSDYRGRMEELASGLLGTPVAIRGEIDFTLLPQPRLTFSNVLVGSPEEPAATVDAVEAEFSLMEFLRDDYNITRLVLRGPVVDFAIDESGFFGSGVSVDHAGNGIGLGDATIEDATIRLMDRRSGETFIATDVDGQLSLDSFSGPIAFQGLAYHQDERYSVRFNSSVVDASGNTRVSAAILAESGAFSLSTEGQLSPGMAPKYDGTLTYRQAPPEALAADEIHGDLVFESKVTGSTDRIVLSGYTLQPDENRAGTRLTGAASIQLGARRSFDAVISGGVFALPPRDASEDASTMPYELVRLLAELPAPILPPMPGRIGVDLAEIGLRGFAVRNVRLDASTDGSDWQIEQFIGQLPGDTEVRASGTLGNENDRPAFRGQVAINATRLGGLVQLWRKPEEDNPLFNQPAILEGRVMLVGDAIGVNGGQLTLAGQVHAVELRLGFGSEKRLDLVGHFAELGVTGSALLGAMLPRIGDGPAFGISFPYGSFSLEGATARVLGQDGINLVAEGQWTPTDLSFKRLAAEDWGGIGVDGAITAGGTAALPQVSASGRLNITAGDAPALTAIYDLLEVPQSWRDYFALSAPADLLLDIEPADETGSQVITMGGALGVGELNLRADLSGGLAGILSEPLLLTAALEADDAAGLTRQVGFGDAALFSGESLLVSVGLQGTPSNSLDTRLTASSGDETVSFAGEVFAGTAGEIGGTGTLDVNLTDAGGLAQLVGANGLSLPLAQGTAQLHFEGERLARLSEIVGTSGDTGFSGDLALSRTAVASAVAGTIAIDAVSLEGLAVTLFGRAALITGEGVWPEGPIAIGDTARSTRGSVRVTAGSVTGGGEPRTGAASFELTWDDARLRLARFEAAIGDATIGADIAVCCAGPLAEKTVSGRISMTGVDLDAVATPAVALALDGLIDGGVRFEATGASIAEAMATLAGEGNFTLADFSVGQLAPEVFPAVAGLEGLLDMDPDALGAIIGLSLGLGDFTAPQASGAFSMAGGVLRLSNMIVEGEGARLAGSLNLDAPTLGLDGTFFLSPRDFLDPVGLVGEDTARIANRIAGTLLAPILTLDVEEMVAAVQVRANELEVERLEILRAEDAERQRIAAEERNRLIEEQRRRAEEEAARLAAEEAARLAAEEEARRLEEERLLLLQQPQAPTTSPSIQTLPSQQPTPPLNLGFQPAVNQPIGNGVNQLGTGVNQPIN